MRIKDLILPCLMAFFILLFSYTPAFGVHHVKVGFYQNKPLIFRDTDGVVKGIFADFINAVSLENDWSTEWVEGTFAEGLERVQRREVDIMAAVAWTQERESTFDFSRKAVISNWGVFYTRRGDFLESILDLEGKTVAVVRRDSYAAGFRDLAARFGINCTFLEVDDYPDVFIAIEDFMVEAGLVSRLFGLANERDYIVERSSQVLEPRDIRFAAPKGSSVTILQILDFHLTKWRAVPDSPLNRSIQNWLTLEPSYGLIPKWFPWFVGAAVALVFGVLFANYALRRKVSSRTEELLKSRVELSREKLFFERLFEESPDALVLESGDGHSIIRVNKGFSRLFGYSREEVEGKTLNEVVVPDEFLEQGAVLDARVGHGKPIFVETIRKNKDGIPIDVSLISVPVKIDEGVVASYTIYRDISAAKEARRALIESRENIKKNLESMSRTWEQTIEVLATAAETRDPYTAGHQRNVSALSAAIAMELGLDGDRVHSIRMAGLVHDIGKINVPAEILSKPGALGEVEFALIRTHPEIGYEIMKNIELPWKLADMIRQHHERMDGSGYPDGLKGDDILIEARIIAVADVVEAMSSHRPYRASLGVESALEEIEKNRGSRYDADVVDACLKLFREKDFRFPKIHNGTDQRGG